MKEHYTFILFALFLSACTTSQEEAVMQDYLQRISRVTEIPFKPRDSSSFPIIPPLQERHYEIAGTHMKAVMALDLLQCPRLSQKVAYRNSSLGKQMPPSQRLHYEKELLTELSSCIDYLQSTEPDAELLPLLITIYQNKQAQLPMIRWNVLFGEQTELVNQLHVGRYSLSDEDSGQTGTLKTLRYLTGYFPDTTTSPPYSREELENHLQQLNASDYSGQLIRSAVQLTRTLNEAAGMIEQRLNASPICPAGKLMPAGERLYNVFQLLYTGKIQPYLVRINQQGTQWQQIFSELLEQLPPAPSPSMTGYIQSIAAARDKAGIWYDLQQSVLRHVEAWQAVFQQCQLRM